MAQDYDFVANDDGSVLTVTCKNDQDKTVIDLAGSTVQLSWRDQASALITKAMTVLNPTINGKAQYQFAVGELFAPGMLVEPQITDAGGKKITALKLLYLSVRKAI